MSRPVVLVTGSAQRVGAELAQYFHNQGYRVMLHARRSRLEAEQLVRQLNQLAPESADVVFSDLSELTAAAEIISSTVKRFGQLNVLVNNASLFMPTPIETSTHEQWDRLFDVNLKACYFLCQQALPYLQQTQGSVVNVTDIHATTPKPLYSLYSMSKAGLVSMTKALAHEFAPAVRVNAVAPGHVLPPCVDGNVEFDSDVYPSLLGHPVLLDDLTRGVFFMATNTSVTGQELILDVGASVLNAR